MPVEHVLELSLLRCWDLYCTELYLLGSTHRRRIKTEEKAKVVAAAWEAELPQFLTAQAIFSLGRYEEWVELHQDEMKNRTNCTRRI